MADLRALPHAERHPDSGTRPRADVAVDEPDVEFGAPATDKDPILDAALERVKLKVAA